MPTGFYEIITDHDMDAIVAYVQTLKPINNKVPDPIYKMAQVRQVFPGAEKPYTEAMFSDHVKHGFYLATIGHCMECHTPMVRGQHDWAKDLGAAVSNSPGLGACRCRATSPRARPRVWAPGPTPRSRPRSPPASTRTATTSSRPWALPITPTTDADDRRHHRLAAHGAGEGVTLVKE